MLILGAVKTVFPVEIAEATARVVDEPEKAEGLGNFVWIFSVVLAVSIAVFIYSVITKKRKKEDNSKAE